MKKSRVLPHGSPAGAPSLSAGVHSRMRAEILAGRIAPGSRLSLRDLARHFGVSLSVVREALARLAEQGMVDAKPQQGFSVAALDVEDLRDLTKVRVLIEGTALHEAVDHADIDYESRVVAAHHRLLRTPMTPADSPLTVTDDWSAVHMAFHDALISASPSVRLREMAMKLRDHAELYQRWSGPFSDDDEPRDVAAEHRQLMEAVLDHDSDRAVQLLTTHLNLTCSILNAYATAAGLTGNESNT